MSGSSSSADSGLVLSCSVGAVIDTVAVPIDDGGTYRMQGNLFVGC
jgi:hypothetical protein